jgi:hypothetical protein
MKISFIIVLATIIAPLTLFAQPSWTDFTYTDWSPDSTAAITGDRAYDSATVWDGNRFVTFFQGTEGEPYLTAASDNGQDWSYLNGSNPISVTNLFSYGMGNHTVACDPDGFPSGDVVWTTESENVRFKMWYADTSTGDHLQYAESTGGINWYAFSEGVYCPPYYKTDSNQYMTKPSVLYRPDGLSSLSTDDPMDNRYLMYLNSAADLDSYYFELYLSSNGLDWTLYGWDSYCESRFSSETIFEEVTFTGNTEPDYVDTFEEVLTNGVRDGWMLWTHNGAAGPIASWYSVNGYDWSFREEPINEIGEMNSQTGYWNEDANINLDSVRLGNNYFFLRSGRINSPSEKYQLGAGIKKSLTSVEVSTPFSPQTDGDVSLHYKLYSWNEQTLPVAFHQYHFFGFYFQASAQGGPYQPSADVGEKYDLAASIGGYPHTYIWDSVHDQPGGLLYGTRMKVVMGSDPDTDVYGTTEPFDVINGITPTPIPTATPVGYKTPSPTITPTPTSTATPTSTPTPSVTPTVKPSPSLTPTMTPTPEPPPPESPTPTAVPPTPTPESTRTPTPTGTPTPKPTVTPSSQPPWIYDYDGDGTSDIGIFRGSSGLWAIRGVTRVYFGTSTDETAPGDYDGDGTTDIGIFRPASGLWALRDISRIYFGALTDEPIQGDYSGDGTWDVGVYRSTSGLWAIRGFSWFYFGGSSDDPVPGYYNSDRTRDVMIYRPSTGLWANRGISRFYFGGSTDSLVPGDYYGSGAWSAGIFRPSNGLWSIRGITRIYFGDSSDTPVPGDYSGSGEDDIGIFRSSIGLWAIRDLTRVYFGSDGEIPVSR